MKTSTAEKIDNRVKQEKGSVIPFVKEVARYFMDFLETDFHKVRNPKRHIQYRTKDNLQVCIPLIRYEKYNKLVWDALKAGFKDTALNELKPRIHTNNIPATLMRSIESRIKDINDKDIHKTIKNISNEIDMAISKHPKDALAALSQVNDAIRKILAEQLLSPFIKNIEEPLKTIKYSSVDSVFQLTEELTSILQKPIEEVALSIVTDTLINNKNAKKKLLLEALDIEDVKSKISSFFSSFAVGDLFDEVTELFNNKKLLDKQEFYFYYFDISYGGSRYPLFYLPVHIEKTEKGYSFEFEGQLYINKKALQFISQISSSNGGAACSIWQEHDRIIYLADKGIHLRGTLDEITKRICHDYGLQPVIDIANFSPQTAKSPQITLTNSCYFGLFDKSDESLINDYEEILQKLESEDDELASAFHNLIDDFIAENPETFRQEVEEEWDEKETGEKLVFSSPVPLNEEQRQILMALNKPKCRYLMVEGPPGTGKSHTITAIVCNAVLKHQSVLVLSDKKEALDVVQDKITATMNKVRLDENFQNPILRLGQTGNTYAKILSSTSINRIKEHYRAVRTEYKQLSSNIDSSINGLKDSIKNNVNSYAEIKNYDIGTYCTLENKFSSAVLPLDLKEFLNSFEQADSLVKLRKKMIELKDHIKNGENLLEKLFKQFYPQDQSIQSFLYFLTFLTVVDDVRSSGGAKKLNKIISITDEGVEALRRFIYGCKNIKLPIVGYLLGANAVKKLVNDFNQAVSHNYIKPHLELEGLETVNNLFQYAESLKKKAEGSGNFLFSGNFFQATHQLLVHSIDTPTQDKCLALKKLVLGLTEQLEKYPNSVSKIGFNPASFLSIYDNALTKLPDSQFKELNEYVSLKHNLENGFGGIPRYDYVEEKAALEQMMTTQMTYKMDEQVINFYEKHQNDAKTIASIITQKKKFDKDSFGKLKESFPCILAGIRDYAEYIPLEYELFDLIIIDEASQVSIAQAFPALLRGKKILVLGDTKQFSNVKSAHARSDTNKQYLNGLRNVFIKTISSEVSKLERLKKFDIKTSVLDFFYHINNYSILLRKHFRGYRELISYSNKFFYKDNLQAIKILSKPIQKVLCFTEVEHDGKLEKLVNTNLPELESIIAELEKIHEEEPGATIGIITPHTNQQKYLAENINKHQNAEILYKQHKLKIMTFDTCQGEERDIILYSMVACKESDKLSYIFLADFLANNAKVDVDEEGKIKLQRLNVGFSRAKERMHFFISKPLNEFTGSIGEALNHYKKTLEDSEKLPDGNKTDPRSPMEKKVLHWIQETPFYNLNKSSISIQAQFPVGEYIRQIDKRYNPPKFVADFLVLYSDEERKEHKIIIEYDGFEHHFSNTGDVTKSNYYVHYTEQHLYREKILESYGYKFIRLNRFNIGKNPAQELQRQFELIVKKKFNLANA